MLNYRFSFRSLRRHSEAVPRFALVAAVSLAINAAAAVLVVGFLFNRYRTFA